MVTAEVMAISLTLKRRLIHSGWMNQHSKNSADWSAGVLIIRADVMLMKGVRTMSHEAIESHQFQLNLFSGNLLHWADSLVNMCQNYHFVLSAMFIIYM